MQRQEVAANEEPKHIRSQSISFDEKNVPTSAVTRLPAESERQNLTTLQRMFEERPVWLKYSLVKHFPVTIKKNTLKQYSPLSLLSCIAYSFENGPWRNAYVRFGYDPRVDPSSVVYQVMDMRNRKERLEGGQLVQLCDVDNERVSTILADLDVKLESCSVRDRQKQTGWLENGSFGLVRKLVKTSPK